MRSHALFLMTAAGVVAVLGAGLLPLVFPLGLVVMGGGVVLGVAAVVAYVRGRDPGPDPPPPSSLPAPPVSATVPAGSPTTRTLPDDRIILDMTIEELTQPFQEHTEIRAIPMVRDYIGKWLEASGQLADVFGEGDAGVRARFTAERYPMFSLSFSDPRWVERLRVTKRGTSIKVRGQITRIERTWVYLGDCELLD